MRLEISHKEVNTRAHAFWVGMDSKGWLCWLGEALAEELALCCLLE